MKMSIGLAHSYHMFVTAVAATSPAGVANAWSQASQTKNQEVVMKKMNHHIRDPTT